MARDIRVQLNVKSGAADLYMATFVEGDGEKNNPGNN